MDWFSLLTKSIKPNELLKMVLREVGFARLKKDHLRSCTLKAQEEYPDVDPADVKGIVTSVFDNLADEIL